MEGFLNRHNIFWKDKATRFHILLSVILLALSLCTIYFAIDYTSDYSGYVVPDILLDNIPVVNVGFIFFQGAFIFLLAVLAIIIWLPKYIAFTLESSALFFFFRSIFMVMTHLSSPNVEYYKYIEHEHHASNVIFSVSSGNDLFFSGHAGFPFLLALVFWHSRTLRLLFLLCSLIGSVAVIFGHLHYTIDVFSAYFITFGVFEISKSLFKKEYAFLLSDTPSK